MPLGAKKPFVIAVILFPSYRYLFRSFFLSILIVHQEIYEPILYNDFYFLVTDKLAPKVVRKIE